MEVSGIVFRPLPCFSGTGFDTHSSKPSSSLSIDAGNRFSGELRLLGSRDSKVSVRPKKFSRFSDCGHLQYYVPPRSGTKKQKKNPEMATIKKKLKLIKGLSRDLSTFSSVGFGVETEDGLAGEFKGKMISEAAEVLLAHLQKLRAEEKEMKRRRKEEKARIKATQMKTMVDSESSSSSSESSDSECGEVVNMSRLRSADVAVPKVDEPQQAILEEATSTSPQLLIQEQQIMQAEGIQNLSLLNCGQESCTGSRTSCSNGSSICQTSVMVGASTERIEVCMGGKCQKSGAAELLEEFERRVSIEGAVVGCKCMGKCRDGPNVRVLNQCNENLSERVDVSVRAPANPLCIGVGLEDVGIIIANFFGEERKDLGLMAA